MVAPSAKSLFQATKQKVDKGPALFDDLPKASPVATRDPLDFDPTPPDATRAVLHREAEFMRRHGTIVWENAVGAGHMVRPLQEHGFDVIGSDIVDRGWPKMILKNFFDYDAAPAPILFTNPPYGEVSARDGHGRWLRHAFDLGVPYVALLLGAEWSFARMNGFDALFAERPPSVEYKCCFKIDFRGKGNPAQRNCWFVWDENRPPLGPCRWEAVRLYEDAPDERQKGFFDQGEKR